MEGNSTDGEENVKEERDTTEEESVGETEVGNACAVETEDERPDEIMSDDWPTLVVSDSVNDAPVETRVGTSFEDMTVGTM